MTPTVRASFNQRESVVWLSPVSDARAFALTAPGGSILRTILALKASAYSATV